VGKIDITVVFFKDLIKDVVDTARSWINQTKYRELVEREGENLIEEGYIDLALSPQAANTTTISFPNNSNLERTSIEIRYSI